jgi:hypothetical protein
LKVWESERQLQDFDEEFNKIFNTSWIDMFASY